jgi:hypothetical protein
LLGDRGGGREALKSSENGTGGLVAALEQFQQNRRVIEDFTSRTLAAISGDYARLLYISSLRDLASGHYHHEGLLAVYPETSVQEALTHCHEELFARILEAPLEQQEWDLRNCLGNLEGGFWGVAGRWRELQSYRLMLPVGVPSYLQDLFCSNLRALLSIFAEARST